MTGLDELVALVLNDAESARSTKEALGGSDSCVIASDSESFQTLLTADSISKAVIDSEITWADQLEVAGEVRSRFPEATLLLVGPDGNPEKAISALLEDSAIADGPLSEGLMPGTVLEIEPTTKAKGKGKGRKGDEDDSTYLQIFRRTKDPIFAMDRTRRYTHANPPVSRLFGRSPAKVIGRKSSDLLDEEAMIRVDEIERRVLHGETVENEFTTNVEGLPTTFHLIRTPLKNKKGKVVGLFGIARDITERKWAEEQSKEASRIHQDFVESLTDWVWEMDSNGIHTYSNIAVENILGYSPGDVIGYSLTKLWSPEERTRERLDGLHALLKGGKGWVNHLNRYRTRDGETVVTESTAIPLFGHHDTLIGYRGMDRNITDRINAEEALRKSEGRFRGILLSLHETMIVVYDRDGRIRYFWSPDALNERYGIRFSDRVGDNVRNLLPKAEAEKRISQIEHVFQSGESLRDEYVVNTEKGDFWHDVSLSAIRGDDGETNSVVGFIRDITERKWAEQALEEEKEYYHSFVESLTDWVWEIDVNGIHIYSNPAVDKALGFKANEVIGYSHTKFIPDEERTKEMLDELHDLLDTGKGWVNRQRRLKNKDGKVVILESTAVPFYSSENKLIGYRGMDRDITERIRSEKRILASLQEKEILLKEIHHRVKNNLQIITSLLNLQGRYFEGDREKEMFKESQNRVKSMGLIHEKLYQSTDISHINFGEYVDDLVRGLIRAYGMDASKVDLELEIEEVMLNIDTAIPCGLIINEIVSNSLKYAFPDDMRGIIRIELSSDEDNNVTLIVSDDGVGIPPEYDLAKADSLGVHLVSILTKNQLKGTLDVDPEGGTKYSIKFKEVV